MGGPAGRGRGKLRPLPRKPKVDAVRNEINVTPLVDVCLVLLIIFMVITPLLARGKDVKLPQTEHHSNEKDRFQPVISVEKNEWVWVAGTNSSNKEELIQIGKLGEPDLGDRIAKEVLRLWEVAKTPEAVGRVFLKVDHTLTYGRIYPLLMQLNEGELSLTSIDLGTAEKVK